MIPTMPGPAARAIVLAAVMSMALAGAAVVPARANQPVVFIPIPRAHPLNMNWVYGVSPDGSFAVGAEENSAPSTTTAMRWSMPGAQGQVLGDIPGAGVSGRAFAASAGGAVVVGSGFDDLGFRPAYWTASAGFVPLPDLPGGTFTGAARAVSRDGGVIVGECSGSSGFEAVRWVNQGGAVTAHPLGDLPGGSFASTARGVSADGSVIVGTGTVLGGLSDRAAAFRWTAATGMTELPGIGPTIDTRAVGVSGDGTTIVGRVDSLAAKWVNGGAPIILGDLPGGADRSFAHAASFDGSVIVGEGENDFTTLPQAVVWFGGGGPILLRDYLINQHGLDLTGWFLLSATGVSEDGRTIVGYGRAPGGRTAGFVVILPSPGAAAPLAAAAVLALRRRRRGAGA